MLGQAALETSNVLISWCASSGLLAGVLLRLGRRLAVLEALLVDASDALIAAATANARVIPLAHATGACHDEARQRRICSQVAYPLHFISGTPGHRSAARRAHGPDAGAHPMRPGGRSHESHGPGNGEHRIRRWPDARRVMRVTRSARRRCRRKGRWQTVVALKRLGRGPL